MYGTLIFNAYANVVKHWYVCVGQLFDEVMDILDPEVIASVRQAS